MIWVSWVFEKCNFRIENLKFPWLAWKTNFCSYVNHLIFETKNVSTKHCAITRQKQDGEFSKWFWNNFFREFLHFISCLNPVVALVIRNWHSWRELWEWKLKSRECHKDLWSDLSARPWNNFTRRNLGNFRKNTRVLQIIGIESFERKSGTGQTRS